MTPVYAQFTLVPDTLNTTDNYDFYVTADIEYTSNVTVPYTSGSNSFYLWANTSFSGISFFRTGCNLSVTPGIGGNTVPAELYTSTVCPLSFGTSYTNILNCNNIKITGIISKETVVSHDTSIYQSYLTVRECGVYLFNSAGGVLVMYPIYCQIPAYSNFTGQPLTTQNLSSYNVSNSGGAGVGRYAALPLGSNDDAYVIYPNYGIKVYSSTNFVGLIIDFYNSTSKLNIIRAVTNNTGNSCRIYYNGDEIISY